MKKILMSIFCAASLLLAACSGNSAVTVQDGNVILDDISVSVTVPDEWAVTVGKDLYEEMLPLSGYSYSDFDEMTEYYEEQGFTYYARACNSNNTMQVVISSQDITPESAEDEQVTLADYARSVHDSTIFDYFASGYKTGGDSSFSETNIGGIDGYLSYFEVYTKDEEPEFTLGFSEFFFQRDELIYTVQICYFDKEAKEEALSVIDSIASE
ncbi:MAG: hypothetical protein E7478_03095 [Ruminococcaceae bacterium]|nr:hypothetical protein [Oscillospiraceae bacterium]